jgi:hypothetical protein
VNKNILYFEYAELLMKEIERRLDNISDCEDEKEAKRQLSEYLNLVDEFNRVTYMIESSN